MELLPEDVEVIKHGDQLYASYGKLNIIMMIYLFIIGEDWDTKTLYSEYDVKRKIGQGGFGSVYLGIHKKTGQKVAIKFVNPSAFGDAS